MNVSFGDRVEYAFTGWRGEGVIIGFHSRWPDIACVATERAVGMTLAADHCSRVGTDMEAADRFRDRYENQFPGLLAARQNRAGETT